MKTNIRRIICIILIFSLTQSIFPAYATERLINRFTDVPAGHWAEESINRLRELKITEGIGNNKFGLGMKVRRSEFVSFLVKLMNWEIVTPTIGSFPDNKDKTKWYYSPIETAYKHGVISNGSNFRPNDYITREEMAIMIVRTLGYDDIGRKMTYLSSPFTDVTKNIGYINIAKDFGIISGMGNGLFAPNATATREQAAAMMMRMYEKLNIPLQEVHAFYAIRSANQSNIIRDLDSVSFGWSRLEYNTVDNTVILNTSRTNNNEYALPTGFTDIIKIAKDNNVSTQLMVFVKNDAVLDVKTNKNIPLAEYIILNPEVRAQVISNIIAQVNNTTKDNETASFDGVVIDFENMKGEVLKKSFNAFLGEIKKELIKYNKKLYVAVHPARRPGLSYYDAYDYRTIGDIADKVILMAHDYNAKKLSDTEMQMGYTLTPPTPIDEIYYALRAITDEKTGVKYVGKIWLQISFDAVQWKLVDNKVINQYPYSPDYETVKQRLLSGVTINYPTGIQNPYATYTDTRDNTYNVLWYEDSRSVASKIEMAKMFNIKGISLWRLGNIPNYSDDNIFLDVWNEVKKR